MKIAIEIDSSEDINQEYKTVRMIKADSVYGVLWETQKHFHDYEEHNLPAEVALARIREEIYGPCSEDDTRKGLVLYRFFRRIAWMFYKPAPVDMDDYS